MINYLIILMLLILLWRQITLIRKIEIRTKKGRFEIGVFTVAIASLAILTIFYGKGYMHYLIAIIAGSFLIVNWLKQGVSKTGLIIVSKAKEDYIWGEIGTINVRTDDIINIDYFSKTGDRIASHKYDMKHYDGIMKIFKSNRMKVKINKAV